MRIENGISAKRHEKNHDLPKLVEQMSNSSRSRRNRRYSRRDDRMPPSRNNCVEISQTRNLPFNEFFFQRRVKFTGRGLEIRQQDVPVVNDAGLTFLPESKHS